MQTVMAMNDWQKEILKKWRAKEAVKSFEVNDAVRNRLTCEFRGEVLYREPMGAHTSIRVGGPADVFLKPETRKDLVAAVKIAREENIPYMFYGWGSNTLVKDGGIRGFVIATSKALSGMALASQTEVEGDIQVEAGVGITSFVHFARRQGLTGVENWAGIPGSMGGAMVMNAGARGVEVADFLREITFMTEEGGIVTVPREKLEFRYRYLKLPAKALVLSGVFRLSKDSEEAIAERIKTYQQMRIDTQPLDYPNLGSIFKNPEPKKRNEVTVGAGQLIEESGLKGIRVGGARVSEKHANFIINEKNAAAKDVLILIGLVRDKVKEKTGVLLETEIKIIGEE